MSGLLQGLVWIADFSAVSLDCDGGGRKNVSFTAKAILVRLADACNDHGVGMRQMSRCLIATDCDCSPETVKKSLKLWRDLGLVQAAENAEGGRGKSCVYEIDVARLVEFIPLSRLPAGLGKLVERSIAAGAPTPESAPEWGSQKGVREDPLSEKGVAGDRKGGLSGPEKGVAGDPHTNNIDTNKKTNRAGARERAGGSPPPGEASESRNAPPGEAPPPAGGRAGGEAAALEGESEAGAKKPMTPRQFEVFWRRRFVMDWLFGEKPSPIAFRNCGFRETTERAAIEALALSVDGPSLREAARFVRWAEALLAGEPQTRDPHPDVLRLMRALADPVAKAAMARRLAVLAGAAAKSRGERDGAEGGAADENSGRALAPP